MNLEISYAEFGVRPPVVKPVPEFLLEVTEKGIRELILKHYDAIKESDIKYLFPQDLQKFEQAKVNSADFFIQICGGQPHFTINREAPRMIGRHTPFKINAKARQVWLELYKPLYTLFGII